MKVFKYNRWLVLVIFIGLLAALMINMQRYAEERQNMTVDLAIDYEGLVELAEREGLPPAEVFRQAKDAGITSLAVYETTFKKLNVNGKATATPGSAILERYQSGALTDAMKALGHLRLRTRKPPDSMFPPITKASGIGTETTGRCLQAISAVRAFG